MTLLEELDNHSNPLAHLIHLSLVMGWGWIDEQFAEGEA